MISYSKHLYYFQRAIFNIRTFQTSVLTVMVKPELGTVLFNCEPSIPEVRTIISQCFDKIIKAATLIPKIETILFPELETQGHLFSVLRYEDEVNKNIRTNSDISTWLLLLKYLNMPP